jgi:hypothetical protein
MQVTNIRYSKLFNTGNYENERFEVEATLNSGDTIESAFDAVQNLVFKQKTISDFKSEILNLKYYTDKYKDKELPDIYQRELDALKEKCRNEFPEIFDSIFNVFNSFQKRLPPTEGG